MNNYQVLETSELEKILQNLKFDLPNARLRTDDAEYQVNEAQAKFHFWKSRRDRVVHDIDVIEKILAERALQ